MRSQRRPRTPAIRRRASRRSIAPADVRGSRARPTSRRARGSGPAARIYASAAMQTPERADRDADVLAHVAATGEPEIWQTPVRLLQQLLRFDTQNPPGNER